VNERKCRNHWKQTEKCSNSLHRGNSSLVCQKRVCVSDWVLMVSGCFGDVSRPKTILQKHIYVQTLWCCVGILE
jgi:hypothetical protein